MGAESKIYFTSPKNTMFNKHPVFKLDFSLNFNYRWHSNYVINVCNWNCNFLMTRSVGRLGYSISLEHLFFPCYFLPTVLYFRRYWKVSNQVIQFYFIIFNLIRSTKTAPIEKISFFGIVFKSLFL